MASIRCLMLISQCHVATCTHGPGRDDGIRANVVLARDVGVPGRPIRRFDEHRIARSENRRAGTTALRSRAPQGNRRERHRHPRARRAGSRGLLKSTRRRGGPETGGGGKEARVRPEQDRCARVLSLVPGLCGHGFDASRSRSEGERTAVVEVSTTTHADAPASFGRAQPAIESIMRDGTSATSALESLQAECSAERNGRISKRRQEQSDQLSETIQGPFPSCWHIVFVSETFFFFARRAQLQHNLDIPRTCKRPSRSVAPRLSTLPVSYSMKMRTTV